MELVVYDSSPDADDECVGTSYRNNLLGSPLNWTIEYETCHHIKNKVPRIQTGWFIGIVISHGCRKRRDRMSSTWHHRPDWQVSRVPHEQKLSGDFGWVPTESEQFEDSTTLCLSYIQGKVLANNILDHRFNQPFNAKYQLINGRFREVLQWVLINQLTIVTAL